jgi:hypothetical protein
VVVRHDGGVIAFLSVETIPSLRSGSFGRGKIRGSWLDMHFAGGSRRGMTMSCRDKFSDYGFIRFVVIDTSSWTIEDFS